LEVIESIIFVGGNRKDITFPQQIFLLTQH
jgi:hypothetical protein